MANSPDSATRSAPPPCGRSSTRRASTRAAADRSDLGAVPPRPGPRRPGLRLVPPRHDHPAPALRVLRHRARHPPRTHPGRHRPPDRSMADPTGPQPTHGPRRRPPALPVPHPRPRHQVHRRLRRRVHRHRIQIIKTPVRAPRANAIAERFVGTIRRIANDFPEPQDPDRTDTNGDPTPRPASPTSPSPFSTRHHRPRRPQLDPPPPRRQPHRSLRRTHPNRSKTVLPRPTTRTIAAPDRDPLTRRQTITSP